MTVVSCVESFKLNRNCYLGIAIPVNWLLGHMVLPIGSQREFFSLAWPVSMAFMQM